MDQSRAVNSLAPFLALAKSANSPRAAADLINQATAAPNTYVFAELLEQPNVKALKAAEQYAGHHRLLEIFAWGTWESYKADSTLPQLSPAQVKKLRLLSLLSIASEKQTSSQTSNLSYSTLCQKLELESTIELEHLVTEAIYNDLITATLNPAHQTVVITSVAPLRDLAPGSVQLMISELAAWSSRCQSVLASLEGEIQKVKSDAARRTKREALAERQIKAATDADKSAGAGTGSNQGTRSNNPRMKREQAEDFDEDDDAMDLDAGSLAGPGKKKSSGGFLQKLGRGSR